MQLQKSHDKRGNHGNIRIASVGCIYFVPICMCTRVQLFLISAPSALLAKWWFKCSPSQLFIFIYVNILHGGRHLPFILSLFLECVCVRERKNEMNRDRKKRVYSQRRKITNEGEMCQIFFLRVWGKSSITDPNLPRWWLNSLSDFSFVFIHPTLCVKTSEIKFALPSLPQMSPGLGDGVSRMGGLKLTFD